MLNGSVMRKQRLSVEPGELKQYLQAFRSDILEEVDHKLQNGIDRIVKDLEFKHRKFQNGYLENSSKENLEKSSPNKENRSPKELARKEFILRDSTFTNLWENAGVRSLYNACFAFFLMLYIHIAIYYYFNVQKLKNDLAIVSWTFSQFHIVTITWLSINFSIVFLLYPIFRFWATSRIFVEQKRFYDAIFCSLFIFFQAAILVIPAVVVIVYNLPPVSSFIVLVEKVRLFMKSYAFVYENTTKVLKYKPHQDGDIEELDPCPKVEKLIYFLLAPTLVYRDNYPRTPHIRWSYAAWSLLQAIYVIGCSYLSHIFLVGTLKKAGAEPIPLLHFICILALAIITANIMFIAAFFSTLHCLQNCFAEILRFGDRLFYDDWWNSTSYARFYRSWNILVHDWLHSYVYWDMYAVLGKSRTGAALAVFLLSAVVHEYILSVCFRFLYPLLFTFFMTGGVGLVFVTRKSTSGFWNIVLWISLFLGYELLNVYYAVEWYARINCPRIIDSWIDYIVPRSLSPHCKVVSFSPEFNSFDWYPSVY